MLNYVLSNVLCTVPHAIRSTPTNVICSPIFKFLTSKGPRALGIPRSLTKIYTITVLLQLPSTFIKNDHNQLLNIMRMSFVFQFMYAFAVPIEGLKTINYDKIKSSTAKKEVAANCLSAYINIIPSKIKDGRDWGTPFLIKRSWA